MIGPGVAIAIGLPSGLVAGYYGGRFDAVANWTTNILLALPGLIVLLAVRAAVGPSTWIAMIVFGVLLSPGYYRLTRTAVGPIELRAMRSGTIRKLSRQELGALSELVGL